MTEKKGGEFFLYTEGVGEKIERAKERQKERER